MPLSPGTRLGAYEVEFALGAGGMGEVYKARDTRLDRTVAIKVLPSHAGDDAQARERFVREARAIAALNHPNICALYDIGDMAESAPGSPIFLVMEYLNGETLADRIARGRLRIDEALHIAVQIASALDRAHRAGIIHRDVKPGNIFLVGGNTSSRPTAKVLDFGLAKTVSAATGATGEALAATLTVPGTIVGTMRYIAPEQLEGKDVDARTDIFAFGAVLHEMLTGAKAFEGQSHASVAAAILGRDPPQISSIIPSASPALDRVVARCLAKDPEERWQSAADLASELRWIADGVELSIPVRPVPRKFTSLGWTLAVAVVIAAVAVAVILRSLTPPSVVPTPKHFTVTLPVTNIETLAISPDGSGFVTGARDDRSYLHSLVDGTSRPLAGTEAADSVFFSPDGKWLGFFQNQRLMKVAIAGGSPVVVSDSISDFAFLGASWGVDDQIVIGRVDGLWRVPASGGTPTRLTTLADGEAGHVYPRVLPGGKAVLFTVLSKSGKMEDAAIDAASLFGGERTRVLRGGAHPLYVPTGHLVYAQQSNLVAMPFDADRLAVTGTPTQVVSGVNVEGQFLSGYVDVARDGTLMYLPGGGAEFARTLVWVDAKGTVTPLPFPPRPYNHIGLLPDGHGLIVEIEQGPHNIWRLDLDTGANTLLTHEGSNHRAVLSPDGRFMAFSSDRSVPRSLFRQATDGSSTAVQLFEATHPQNVTSWSADGRWIAITESNAETKEDIWILATEGDRRARPFLRTRFSEQSAVFSPDSAWIAYTSDDSGRREVYITAFPGPGPRRQVSTDGGVLPLFSQDGRQLFYRSLDRILVVDVVTQPSLSTSVPRVRFQIPDAPAASALPFPVSASGDRVLYPKEPTSTAGGRTVHVVANWFEELRRLTVTR